MEYDEAGDILPELRFPFQKIQSWNCLSLIGFLAYPYTLKMDAIFSSETLVNFYRTSQRHTSEDCTLVFLSVLR
jgi:hypothetical protein